MSSTDKALLQPPPGTKIRPVFEYSDEQKAKLAALRDYGNTLLLPESDPYHIWEKRWLNKPDTIPRYMRAAKWKLEDGKKRIKGTVEWRRDFKPDLISPDEVKIEAETGKILLTGFDLDGRPIIYMRPGLENTERGPRQLRHLVWWLERAKDIMPPGQESLVIIVDYKTTTLRSNPPISLAGKVLTILQQHYVETLGRAIVVNLPFLLNFFYKGISPFLDPVTREKMRFNPDLFELISREHLDADFGGDYQFAYNAESYWQQIVDFCGIAPDGTRLPGYFDGPNIQATYELGTPMALKERSDELDALYTGLPPEIEGQQGTSPNDNYEAKESEKEEDVEAPASGDAGQRENNHSVVPTENTE